MARRSILPFGPQHPVLPEPIQLRLELEDEKVVGAVPVVGYVHRGLEKLAETKDFQQNAFLIERICGICSFIHSQAYCQAVEDLMGVEVPARARYLRTMWAELHRLHSHLLWVGCVADAFGFENLFMIGMKARELVLDAMEATAGARILLGMCSVGGVRRDLDQAGIDRVLAACDQLDQCFATLLPAIANDYSVKKRLVGVGTISAAMARERGAVGPVARACGLPQDLRTLGYAAYRDLEFKPALAYSGDCYGRTTVRLDEMRESVRLVRAAVRRLPAGEISVPVKGNPPAGETVMRLEQPRGEVLYYLRGNGTRQLDRLRVRTPTFANVPALLGMLPGCQLADVPVIILSIDPCISCTER